MKRILRNFIYLPKIILENVADKRKRQRIRCAASTKLASEAQFSVLGSPGSINIGEDCIIHGLFQTFDMHACITIGDHVFIGPQTRIWSHTRVTIGNRVLIAHGVNIIDSNSHSISAAARHVEFLSVNNPRQHRTTDGVSKGAINIGDDAWIGLGAIILKNVNVGRGAIVAAGAVVTSDVADFAVVGGNPAVVIGQSKP